MGRKVILSMAVIMVASSVFATGSYRCKKTTSKCGTRIVKPLCGYGGQTQRHRTYKRDRCGGCGGYTHSR